MEIIDLPQSKNWDMDISLKELVEHNPTCKIDRRYKAHKYDAAYHGNCIYLKHPAREEMTLMIGISESGFTYMGDGTDKDLPLENTLMVFKEVLLYKKYIEAREVNINNI